MTSPTESITCPWCQQHWVTRPGLDCARCGGPLPPPPGPSLSLAPPPAPRKLPDAFLDRLKKRYFGLWFGNLFLMIGVPILVVGLVLTCFAGPFALIPLGIGGVFATIGYMFRRHESRKMNATLEVLSRGMAAEARIAQVTRDPRELYNGEPAILRGLHVLRGRHAPRRLHEQPRPGQRHAPSGRALVGGLQPAGPGSLLALAAHRLAAGPLRTRRSAPRWWATRVRSPRAQARSSPRERRMRTTPVASMAAPRTPTATAGPRRSSR
jgi:hypothetical protein